MHDEILLSLGRLEGKVDALIQLQRIQEDQLKNHEERLRVLEQSKSFYMGVAAVIGAAVSMGFNFLNKHLT
jgi:hypothetical protein